jgi:hypothetical protein
MRAVSILTRARRIFLVSGILFALVLHNGV